MVNKIYLVHTSQVHYSDDRQLDDARAVDPDIGALLAA